MTDWTKPQPCKECGKMVTPNEKHSYEDCINWKRQISEIKKVQRCGHKQTDFIKDQWGDSFCIGCVRDIVAKKAKKEEHERIMEALVYTFLTTTYVPIRKSDLKQFIREQRKYLLPINDNSTKKDNDKEQ